MKYFVAPLMFALLLSPTAAATVPEVVRTEAREMLARLIGFETSIGLGQVPAMAEYLAGQLRQSGFAAEDIHILPLGETASLVVRYRGDGSGGRPVLLLAHMDVVPARREDWQRDPFTLIEEGGYFFGRGTQDTKGTIAAITTTFMRLRREDFLPSRDLVIVFTGDEETAQATTLDLVSNHRDLIDAEFALNGDGGGGVLADDTGEARVYHLQGAEKAYATFEISAHNPGGHSSAPRPDNAIYDLADALKALQAHRFALQWNDWTLAGFAAAAKSTPGELGDAMRRFAADPSDARAAERLAEEPALQGRVRTTCVATKLRAGHAENALAQTATATVNCRVFPGTEIAVVEAELQQLFGRKIDISVGKAFSSPASPMRDDVLQAVTRAVRASYPGVRIVPDQAPYYTDGRVLRGAGIPTYGVGGNFSRNSDNFAHGLNERLAVQSFYNSLTHWQELVRAVAGHQ